MAFILLNKSWCNIQRMNPSKKEKKTLLHQTSYSNKVRKIRETIMALC